MAQIQTTTLPAVVAGTPLTQIVVEVPATIEEDAVSRIMVTAPSTVAAQGVTNFATLTVRQVRAGAFLQNLGVLNVGTTGLTAEVPLNLALTQGLDNAVLQAGDVIDVAVTHTGTGGVLPAGTTVAVELGN